MYVCLRAVEVVEKSLVNKHEQLGRRVSFKDDVRIEIKVEPLASTDSDVTMGVGQGPQEGDTSPKGKQVIDCFHDNFTCYSLSSSPLPLPPHRPHLPSLGERDKSPLSSRQWLHPQAGRSHASHASHHQPVPGLLPQARGGPAGHEEQGGAEQDSLPLH